MGRAGAEVLIVSNPLDVGYLTGFLGGDSWLVVGMRGKPVLLSDQRYEEELERFGSAARVVMRDGSMLGAVAREVRAMLAGSRKRRPVGVQAEDLTLEQYESLAAEVKKARAPASMVGTRGLVMGLREIKDEYEVGRIEAAVRVQEAALEAVLPELRAGMSEREICARLESEMMARGSSGPSFATIVGAQANGSKPHYRPAGTKTKRNTALLIDWGATVDGYHSDMTRTVSIGRWPKELREAYPAVLAAHEAAAGALRAGVLCRDVDAAARSVLDEAGLGKLFTHSLGHGIGLQIHERPGLSRLAGEARLRAGHVVTVEPGVYVPGVGGIRLEDDYLVTERGARRLCRLRKDLDWATLD
jgi:Xaa-Pro aminopeptidase